MKHLIFLVLVALFVYSCADAAAEMIQDASVPDAEVDASCEEYDASLFCERACDCDCEEDAWPGVEVPCTDFGSGQSIAVFQVRPGITQVEECYTNTPGAPAGPLTGPYCWRGFAWWTTGTTDGFMFCNGQTTSVKVFY